MSSAEATRGRRPRPPRRSCAPRRGSFSPGGSDRGIAPYPEVAATEARPGMHAQGRLRFARLLAPLALIAVTVAILAMGLGSGVVGDDNGSETAGSRALPPAN